MKNKMVSLTFPFDWPLTGGDDMMQEVHVACPCCKNKRLFDANPMNTVGTIKIKCPICKSVIAVKFQQKKVRTELIAAR